jgi:small ubiquitin-related modifier
MAEEKSDTEQLNLKVVGQDGQVIAFKIKRNTPFRKLMHAYCERNKQAQNTLRFTFDGTRMNDNDTPKSMDMEDNDTIEVFTQQTGGTSGSISRENQLTSISGGNQLTSGQKVVFTQQRGVRNSRWKIQ